MFIDREKLLQNFIEQADFMEDRIKFGIESNRKGFCRLNFYKPNGEPAHNVHVYVKQLTHDFMFGCPLFKLGTYQDPDINALYEQRYLKLFNCAIAPFYWLRLEPWQGKSCYHHDYTGKGLPTIDQIVAFSQRHNIPLKGHPLFWMLMLPSWLPKNYEDMKPLITKRLREIGQLYDGIIKYWDVVNESTVQEINKSLRFPAQPDREQVKLSGDYVEWRFRQADRYFPDSNLLINEVTSIWKNQNLDLAHYYM